MPDGSHEETLIQLRAAQAGDRAAAERLFTRYRDRVLQIVSVLLAKRRAELLEDEEDLVQTTLLDAFRDLRAFEPRSEGAFLHWLSRLAEDNIRDAWRRQGTRKRGEGCVRALADLSTGILATSLLAGREPAPSAVARARELEEQIESALVALPERERRVLVLRKLCGLPFEEVARQMDLGAASSARSLCSRAVAGLSARLSEPDG